MTFHPPLEVVEEYYRVPPVPLPEGKGFGCPMPGCDYTNSTAQAIGPHKAGHMRHHGKLRSTGSRRKHPITASDKYSNKTERRVQCPRCPLTITRGHLIDHLAGRHKLGKLEAKRVGYPVLDATRGTSHGPSLQVVPAQPTPPPEPVSVVDAAIAVLMGTTGKDAVKMADLPEVLQWFAHTQQVVTLVRDS